MRHFYAFYATSFGLFIHGCGKLILEQLHLTPPSLSPVLLLPFKQQQHSIQPTRPPSPSDQPTTRRTSQLPSIQSIPQTTSTTCNPLLPQSDRQPHNQHHHHLMLSSSTSIKCADIHSRYSARGSQIPFDCWNGKQHDKVEEI